MIFAEVTLRYAKALFNIDSSADMLEKRLMSLNQLVQGLNQSPQNNLFFSSPQISLKDKEKILKSIIDVADGDLLSFLIFLLRERRFNYLAVIAQKYDELVKDKLGMLEVQLTTAIPLTPTAKESLIKSLENRYKKKISLNELIDARLIGGGILIIDNQRIDFSIKGKLARLKEDLLSVTL